MPRPATGISQALATMSVLTGVMAALGQEPRPATPVQTEAIGPLELLARAEALLGVRAAQLVELDDSQLRGSPIDLSIPIGDAQYTLELEPVSVRAADYQLLVQSADGDLVPTTPGPVRTYRGRLLEVEGSGAAGSWMDSGIHAVIMFADRTTYGLEPLAGRVVGAEPGHYVIYPHHGILAEAGACATPDTALPEGETAVPSDGGVAAGTVLIAELAVDSDVEYYQFYGSVAATEAQIHSIINTVNVQYERDIGVRNVIGTLIVRPAEPDGYSATSVGELLNDFRDFWNGSYSYISRDAAQLFTGKVLPEYVGMAYTNSLCYPTAAYSVVRSNACTTFACKTDLSAHELGHIWSANHCNCPGWTMNPTITSGNRFHPTYDIPEMLEFRDTRTCLEVGDKCDGTGTVDCNENGTADGCDVALGTSGDADVNGTPDECQPPPMPTTESVNNPRNRAIALAVPTAETVPPGTPTALRVRLQQLENPFPPNPPGHPPQDFSAYEAGATCTDPNGCVRWIGKPTIAYEYQGRTNLGSFPIARLQCTPYYHDWPAEGFFHVVGAEIMPSSYYEVENLAPLCAGREDACPYASLPNLYLTGRYADVIAPFDPPDYGNQPDAGDVTALVNKFKGLPGAISKDHAVIQPNVPDWNVDTGAMDIVMCVVAYRGFAYPYSGPCPCPSTVICEQTPCGSSSSCPGGTCVHTCLDGDDAGQPCYTDLHCRNGTCGPGYCRDRCERCSPP